MQQFSFIDLFESTLHVSGDRLAHLQEHFFTVYTALVQCTDIAADRVTGRLQYQSIVRRLYIQSKVLLKMGEFVA